MNNIKVNMNEGKFIRFSNPEGSMNARLVLDDSQHWNFTDVHCSGNELEDIIHCLNLMGINPGKGDESHENDGLPLPFPLSLLM